MRVKDKDDNLSGEGLKYLVYEAGDGRVKKVPRTREEMREFLNNWYDSGEKETANLMLEMRERLRKNEGYETADRITDALEAAGFQVKDTEKSSEWFKQ